MKKSIKKLTLNKKAVSNLSKVSGGLAAPPTNTGGPLTCTDPTALTWCYICPVDPIDPFDPFGPADPFRKR